MIDILKWILVAVVWYVAIWTLSVSPDEGFGFVVFLTVGGAVATLIIHIVAEILSLLLGTLRKHAKGD